MKKPQRLKKCHVCGTTDHDKFSKMRSELCLSCSGIVPDGYHSPYGRMTKAQQRVAKSQVTRYYRQHQKRLNARDYHCQIGDYVVDRAGNTYRVTEIVEPGSESLRERSYICGYKVIKGYHYTRSVVCLEQKWEHCPPNLGVRSRQ